MQELCKSLVNRLGFLAIFLFAEPVLFVEQNLPFQFQAASTAVFAALASQKNVQKCSPSAENFCDCRVL